MFADDSTAYLIGNNLTEVIDGLNRIADTTHHLCIDRKLTINAEKTQAMLINRQEFVGPLRRLSVGGGEGGDHPVCRLSEMCWGSY